MFWWCLWSDSTQEGTAWVWRCFYDRTLAAMVPRPHTIGIALADAELPTIYPQPHDIPMDVIATERFIWANPHPL